MLGQIDTVTGTQGSTTTKLASYQYLPSGAIDTLILMPDTTAFTRQYQYLPNDWPTSVQDKAIQETLQYTQEACDGTGYYNGATAYETVQYKQGQAITSAQCFTIDHLNRLTTANTDEKKQSWQLDDNGNFTTHQVNDTTYTYHLKSPTNQLQSINSSDGQFERQYGYTANGQIDAIQMGSTTLLSLDYNRWNGLPESMTNDQGQTLSFTYNPDNLRVVKQVHQGQTQVSQTRYVIGLSGLPVVEVDETSTQSDTKRLIGLPGATLIYYATNQQYYWALTDHLGSTRAVVDQTGRTVAQYDYDVYGVPTIVQEPPFAYDYLFTGQYYDQEVGLYNYHARFYDPTIARFLMVDPALQGFNPYSYVGDMPESFTDPSGEIFGIDDFLIALAISAAIGAAIGAGVGGATYGISTAASGGKFDTGDFFKSMGIGAAAGAVGGAVGFGVGTGITARSSCCRH